MYLAATLGFALLFGGGEGLVRGAVSVARRFGLSSLLIGLTVVAAGTSAPELLVSVSAALQGNADIAIGNVVGSNIFNALLIIGATAMIRPTGVAESIARVDVWVMTAAALVLVPLLTRNGRIGRRASAVLIAVYATYAVLLLL
jgi:cation:H+ antiporter